VEFLDARDELFDILGGVFLTADSPEERRQLRLDFLALQIGRQLPAGQGGQVREFDPIIRLKTKRGCNPVEGFRLLRRWNHPALLLGICFWRKVREERIWAEYMGEKPQLPCGQ